MTVVAGWIKKQVTRRTVCSPKALVKAFVLGHLGFIHFCHGFGISTGEGTHFIFMFFYVTSCEFSFCSPLFARYI